MQRLYVSGFRSAARSVTHMSPQLRASRDVRPVVLLQSM